MKIFSLLAAVFITSLLTLPAIQVTYSFTGAAGNEVSLGPDAQPAGMSAGNVSRGSGLTASAAANAFSSSAWTSSANRDLTDYYTVSLSPQAGFLMTVTRLELDERRSLTGIRSWSLYSSLDGFTSALGTFAVPDDDLTRVNQGVNLGGVFANLTAPVEFRIYGFQSEATGGTWRIDNLELSATATAATSVPDGGSVVLLWLISGLTLMTIRSRSR
jgi:hypothetical protein